jgi:hypothetical protein
MEWEPKEGIHPIFRILAGLLGGLSVVMGLLALFTSKHVRENIPFIGATLGNGSLFLRVAFTGRLFRNKRPR